MRPLLTGFLFLAPSLLPVQAQTLAGDPDKGYTLAKEICVRCHRIGKAEETEKLYPATAFQEIADRPQSTEMSLRVFLKSPHQQMPDLILSETDIDNVVAYILGLK